MTEDAVSKRGAEATGSVSLQPSSRKRKSAWARELVAVGMSIAAHAAVVAALLARPPNETGNVTTPSQAISVEAIATDVLDAVDVGETQAALATAPTAESSISEIQPVAADDIETKQDASEVAAVTAVDEASSSEDIAVITGDSAAEAPVIRTRTAPKKAAERPLTPQKSTSEKPKRRLQKADRRQDNRKSSRNKSSTNSSSGARGSSAKAGAKARLSASRGDIAGYAARVRARVAQRRPSGNGARGTVVVSFSVNGSGSVSSVQIRSSSGNRGLDSGALSAVRGAGPFPPTPNRQRLSFAVPFHYN